MLKLEYLFCERERGTEREKGVKRERESESTIATQIRGIHRYAYSLRTRLIINVAIIVDIISVNYDIIPFSAEHTPLFFFNAQFRELN